MTRSVEGDAGRALTRLAHEQARRNHAAIEQACEAALQGGRAGVCVTRNGNGTVTVEVCLDVPFGTIHEHILPPVPTEGDADA